MHCISNPTKTFSSSIGDVNASGSGEEESKIVGQLPEDRPKRCWLCPGVFVTAKMDSGVFPALGSGIVS